MITAEQRAARRLSLGSSDSPAIVGVDPWRTAGDIYWAKINELPELPSINEAIDAGNRLESVLLDLAEERYGALERDCSIISEENCILAANLDARLQRRDVGIEAKYVGPKAAEYWGEPETDQVPDHVAIQCQHQMHVAGLDRVHVVAGICDPFLGLRFRFYHVEYDADLIDAIVTACLGFWRNHVVPKIPPPNSPPSLETLKRIRREPSSVIDLGPEAVDRWNEREVAARAVKAAEQAHFDATARVMAMLLSAEAGRLPDGRLICYAEENAGDRLIDSKAAKAAYPDLFTPSTRRVLRLKKGAQ